MKIRNGFVSNSSSSSFIVMGNNINEPKNITDDFYTVGHSGNTKFGWDRTFYSGVDTRINFAFLQAMLVKNVEWINMLEKVIKEYYNISVIKNNLSLEFSPQEDYVNGYIDHQSSAEEGTNIEIFNDEETLKMFLFSADSGIQGGNDNE